MDDDLFDKDLLVSLIDGLGYFSEDTLTYEKNRDTLGAVWTHNVVLFTVGLQHHNEELFMLLQTV
jgi:hypothetical protein